MGRNEGLFNAIGKGDRDTVRKIVEEQISAGEDIVDLLNNSMIPAMRDMGEKFSRNEAYVPDMLIAARAMQTGLDLIGPLLEKSGHKSAAKVCIGTIKGDLHDIGKNLVAMMLKGAGYEVIDLGVDCDINKYDQAVSEGAQAVMCSALLTTTMPYMKTVVEHFKDRPDVLVIIGGAPVTQEYAEEIGADGYGTDANQAVKVIENQLR